MEDKTVHFENGDHNVGETSPLTPKMEVKAAAPLPKPKYVPPKCSHGKARYMCVQCGGASICEHNRYRSRCRPCGGSLYCEHFRRKNQCKECGGSAICEHKRRRAQCKECKGSAICEHNRERYVCKECGGASICEHRRVRGNCKECGGTRICEHGRARADCKECGGASICEHNRRRSFCKECKGNSLCEHLMQKAQCRQCKGSATPICVHNKVKSWCRECRVSPRCPHNQRRVMCKDCGGGGICEHKRQRSLCKECWGGSICEHSRIRGRCKECIASGKAKGRSRQQRDRGAGGKEEGVKEDGSAITGGPSAVTAGSVSYPMATGGAGDAVVWSKGRDETKLPNSARSKIKDEAEEMAEGQSDEELVHLVGRRCVRREQGSAKERAEARMLEAAIRASLGDPGWEEEAGGDADPASASPARLASSEMHQDRGHTDAMQRPPLPSDATEGEQMCAGKRVEVLFGDGGWYPGTVARVADDNSAATVHFDDGDKYTLEFPHPAIRLL